MNKLKILDYNFYKNLKLIFNMSRIFGPDCTYDFDNYCYKSPKYINIFNLKDINFKFQNKYNFKFKYKFNIITYEYIYNQLKTQNLNVAEIFKKKLIKLNLLKKEIKIFKLNYLIKNKSFNKYFNKYLKIFNIDTVENCWQDIGNLLYSKFFNYFFNFIIYKAQKQNTQKFGFNSLMSIKNNQKLQYEDLNEVYIYIHKDLSNNELNRQLNYIVNKILEN